MTALKAITKVKAITTVKATTTAKAITAMKAMGSWKAIPRATAAVVLSALAPALLHGVTPTVSNVRVVTTDRDVQIIWNTDILGVSTRTRCFYDYDTVSLDRRTQTGDANSGSLAVRNCLISDLAPATKVYAGPQSRDSAADFSVLYTCTTTCTNCGSSDHSFFANNSGLNCDAVGEYPNFTTDALVSCSGGPPCSPAAPSHAGLTSPPTVTGSSRTVASGCTDLQAQLNSAATAASAGGTVEEVIIPAGLECRPENESSGARTQYSLPNVSSPGRVYVHSGANAKLLPPAGTRVDPSYFPFMGVIQYNEGNLTDLGELVVGASGRRGWYIMGIVFKAPDIDEQPILSYTVTGVNSGSDTITVASTSGLDNGSVVLVDLSGTGMLGGQGPSQACSVTATTLQLRSGGCGGTLRNLTGTYTSGGTVTRFIARPIASISNTTPVRLTFSSAHGIPDFIDATISGASGNQLTISGNVSDYQISAGDAVWVQGNGACDGRWKAHSVGASTITLAGASGCGTSGTVRRVRAFSVFGTADSDLNKPWHYDVVSSTQIDLLGSTAQGTVSPAGHVAYDPDAIGTIVNVGDIQGTGGMSDVTFDRCAWDAPFPWRTHGQINATGSARFVLENSWLRGQKWFVVDPITQDRDTIALSPGTNINVLFQNARDIQIVNSTFWPHTYLFADSANGVMDVSIRRNTLFNPDFTTESMAASDGNHYFQAFCIELKSCAECAVTGNYLKGCRANFNQNGPAVSLFAVGSVTATTDNENRDILVESNTVERTAGFLQLASTVASATAQRLRPTERIKINNNLVVNIDRAYYSAIGGAADANTNTGRFIQQFDGVVDLIQTRNTYHVRSARAPLPINFGGNRSQGHKNEDNTYVITEGVTDADKGVKQDTSGGMLPAPAQANGSAAFYDFYVRGTGPDPLSEFRNNVIIPGIETSSSGDYTTKAASTDTADSLCVHELINNATMTTFSGLTFVGTTANPCNESFNTRLDAAFEAGAWKPKAAFNGKGADIDKLKEDQGRYGDVSVMASMTQATISWTAPDSDACTVDLTNVLDFSSASNITRQTYAGTPSKSQSVTFNGLTAATNYAYRISCKRPALRGLLTTGG